MVKKGKKLTAHRTDVRSPKDIPAFESLLSKGPMAVVLVYADWCGHCTRFKENVWNDKTLSKTHNLNTAAVHYDMVDQTSLKNTPIAGYPSMFLVGKDKKAKEIPTPQDSNALLELDQTSASPLESMETNNNVANNNNNLANSNNRMNNNNVANSNNRMNTNNNVANSNNRMNTNNNTANRLNNNNSLNNNTKSYSPLPPNALDDVVNSSETNSSMQKGGDLFSVLSQYVQQSGGRTRQHRKSKGRKNRRSTQRKRK